MVHDAQDGELRDQFLRKQVREQRTGKVLQPYLPHFFAQPGEIGDFGGQNQIDNRQCAERDAVIAEIPQISGRIRHGRLDAFDDLHAQEVPQIDAFQPVCPQGGRRGVHARAANLLLILPRIGMRQQVHIHHRAMRIQPVTAYEKDLMPFLLEDFGDEGLGGEMGDHAGFRRKKEVVAVFHQRILR